SLESKDKTTVLESSIGERLSVRCHLTLDEAATLGVDSTREVLDAILPIAQSTNRPPKVQPTIFFLSIPVSGSHPSLGADRGGSFGFWISFVLIVTLWN